MAYEPTVWKDHILSSNTYNISENADGTVNISPAGEVVQQGTKMSAENFNRMEQGIYETSKSAEKNSEDIAGINASIANIQTALSGKASSADVYTKSETDTKITEKVAEIVAGAPADFDTLKEMSDWIANHEGSAAAMNSAINANAENIANIQSEIGDMESVLSSVVEVV